MTAVMTMVQCALPVWQGRAGSLTRWQRDALSSPYGLNNFKYLAESSLARGLL
jgi:hypothetical protein